MLIVHVLQGLPGSGKTTWVRRTFTTAQTLICSADKHLLDAGSTYVHSPERVQAAHQACLREYVEAVRAGESEHIVVDNTNLTVAEMSPYVQFALAYGATPRIVLFDTPLDVCLARQVHRLSRDTLEEMARQLASFNPPAWWPERVVVDGLV